MSWQEKYEAHREFLRYLREDGFRVVRLQPETPLTYSIVAELK
jgi:Holliday junction resolvase